MLHATCKLLADQRAVDERMLHRSLADKMAFVNYHKGKLPFFTSKRRADCTAVLTAEERAHFNIGKRQSADGQPAGPKHSYSRRQRDKRVKLPATMQSLHV